MEIDEIVDIIINSKNTVFLTGAGVSTLSGIPDYRSMQGIYHNIENPEYLLSHTCFENEPDKFFNFVKGLYHPKAKPNIIHNVISELEKISLVNVITQNIDGLHSKAGSENVYEFHGNLYDLYCTKCLSKIKVEDYLNSYIHYEDNGIIRPKVVLYEENLNNLIVSKSIQLLSNADVVVVVGTSLKVYPFASLIDYIIKDTILIVINKEKINNHRTNYQYNGDALHIFENISNRLK